jgi:hypothetical protein
MKTPRWTVKVRGGLDSIAAHLDLELSSGVLSIIECRCEGCRTGEDCVCPEDYAGKCDGCRTVEEWNAAISWIGGQLRKHRKGSQ